MTRRYIEIAVTGVVGGRIWWATAFARRYDNEWGYSNRLVDLCVLAASIEGSDEITDMHCSSECLVMLRLSALDFQL